MPARNKPYEQFGAFILFKRLEADALSELWRAGKIEGSQIASTVALRRFTGGDRAALTAAAATARNVVPQLSGTSFAKNQTVEVINGVPCIAHEYGGGRSLRHIVDRARGGTGTTPNPIPIDQAIIIAERVALSLATTSEMKMDGNRLVHGALIPQFIWILDDGEIRVAGQQFGSGLLASLSNGAVAAEIGRYFAPEYRSSGLSSKTTDVYSMGAILYLLLTGAEPPDPVTSSAFAQTVRAAKTPSGAAVPDDLRLVLEKSLAIDPAARYASIADMKQALSGLAHSGKYSATTFNLAFYISNLLKKEMEGESIDRDREGKVNLAPYLEAPPERPAEVDYAPTFAGMAPERKSRMPLAVAAGVALVAIGAGAFYMLGSHKNQAAPATSSVVAAQTIAPQPKPAPVTQPLVASTGTAADPATTSAADEAARKKAFEEAVQQKLQEEMTKLQQDYLRQLKQSQSKNAPVQVAASAPPPAPVRTATREETPSAAQLDQQRSVRPETQTTAAPVVPQPSAAAITQTQPAAPQPQPAAASTVREGDVVDMNELDATPKIVRAVSPAYPPIALSQRIQTTIFVSVLISERGDVADVKVLKGDKRFGFEDAALRAVRAIRFTPPTKDGKRVKTWFAIPIKFTL